MKPDMKDIKNSFEFFTTDWKHNIGNFELTE